jgi:hypothetical protein
MWKDIVLLTFIANASLLILHELESAFEKEWEILRLPGGISGFLLLHIPILLFLFYGTILIERGSAVGLPLSIIAGIGGAVPLMVHKVLVRRSDRFNRIGSNVLLFANCGTGILLIALGALLYAKAG